MIKEHEMVGWYFVTTDSNVEINHQGIVESQVDELGYFMVRFFSWVDGAPTSARLVHIDEMQKHFTFTGKTSVEHDEFCQRFGERKVRVVLPWENPGNENKEVVG